MRPVLAGVPPHTAPGGGTHPADASCSARISRARATSTCSPAVSGGSGLRGTSPGTNDSTSRPCSSTPNGRGAPVNPASRKWARYACTVRLNGRSGRRTVSPIRTIPWVTPSPVSGSPSLTPQQPSRRTRTRRHAPGPPRWHAHSTKGPTHLGGHVDLAGASAGTLARDDHAGDQQFTAPDTPRLSAPERPGQAGHPDPAALAQGFGLLYILRRLGEEQLRVLAAGKIRAHQERGTRSHAGTRVPAGGALLVQVGRAVKQHHRGLR